MEQEDKLDILRNILLTDEREYVTSIQEKIKALENTINEKEELSKKVGPLIKEQLDNFVQQIPQTLGPTITEVLKTEIKNSQDAVVEALYPILGKLVKRYVQNEMRMLTESINSKMSSAFSIKGLKRKFKAKQKGVTEAELILQEQINPTIDQIMVIEKGSGLLISKYTKTQNIEEDVVAGMLTAIKSFAEDAFHKEDQDLQYIEYDTYHLHIQNFSSYYIAVAISGPYNQVYKSKLEDKLLDFAQNVINQTDLSNEKAFTKKIERYFGDDNFQ